MRKIDVKLLRVGIMKSSWTAFFLGTIFVYILLLVCNKTTFYWDSSGYWNASSRLLQDGHFTLNPVNENGTSILSSHTGYIMILIIFILRGFTFFSFPQYWFLLSCFTSLVFTVILPRIFELAFDVKINAIKRVVIILLFMIMWPGLIVYPLSEIPALFFSLLSIYFLLKKRQITPPPPRSK